jgi:hypothetical protein
MKSLVVLSATIHAILFSSVLQAQRIVQDIQPHAHTPLEVTSGSARFVGPYDQAQKLRLAFALKTPKPDEEKKFLDALYTPGSPEYHKFLTAKEWNESFSPSAADEQAVVDWAQSQGLAITNRYPNRLMVDVEAPVAQIQRVFGININQYQVNSRVAFSNDRDPVIPAPVSGIIASIVGLNNVQVLRPHSNLKKQLSYPDYAEGPSVALGPEFHANGDRKKLMEAMAEKKNGARPALTTDGILEPTDLYGASAYDLLALSNLGHCCNPNNNPGGSPPETSIAILSIGSINMSDIQGFQKQYPYVASNVSVIHVDGTSTTEDGEGTLDVEWAMTMGNSFDTSADTAHVYLYEGANTSHLTFLHLYERMLTDGLARVMSTSWGGAELFVSTPDDMTSENEVLSAMSGQGWTLVAASDDRGSVADCAHVIPDFPASSPNVIAAGGTTLSLNSDSTFNSEIGWVGGDFAGACSENAGGSGGGTSSFFGVPFYQAFLGEIPAVRTVPDLALNANTPQVIFLDGELQSATGTSIVAPEIAGFSAQENAYLLFLQTHGVHCFGNHACAPIGNANFPIYAEQQHAPNYAPHYPFYDITSGCASNDITINSPQLIFYCASPGYDMVTGLGSFNMLQLAWAINYDAAGDLGPPQVEFTGPPTNAWYKTDQSVALGFFDTTQNINAAIGLAGFSLAWDHDPAPESFSEPTPGSTDAFYHGPAFPNQDRGIMILSQAGQGCHTVNAKAWDNAGTPSGLLTYGPLCYDTIPPVTSATLSGATTNGVFTSRVVLKLPATDAGSGVASTMYSRNGGKSYVAYTGPVTLSNPGTYIVNYFSKDVAQNVEVVKIKMFTIRSSTTTRVTSSLNPSIYAGTVTLTASITPATGTAPTGAVTFKDGSSTLGTASLSGGKANFATAALTAGSHSITAVYGGSAGDSASTSAAFTETVNRAPTTTSVSSSLNPSSFGKSVALKATILPVLGGSPLGGTVTFKDGSTALGTASISGTTNTATFSTSALGAGRHSITAIYSGGPNRLGSTSPVITETVNRAATSTAVVSSLNPATHGSAITFTATVTPPSGIAVSGTVTFKDGTATLGTGSVNTSTHKATFTTFGLVVGSHQITAGYGGTANLSGSTSAAITQVIR